MRAPNIKSWVTFTGLMCLYVIVTVTVIALILKIEHEETLMNVFTTVFTLFTNVITAVTTFYFTRKSVDSTHSIIDTDEVK